MRGRRRFGALVGCLAFGLLIASAGVSAAASPSAARQARTIAYWTPSRIAHATPRGIRFDPRKAARPTKRPVQPGSGVTGASWTKGGAILTRSGKVWFTLNSGDYICSGSVVDDTASGVSIVLTAGHCAYDGADGGFARNWMFIPDFDDAPTYTCANTIYGCWAAQALVVDSGFATSDGFNSQATRHDWAFAVVPAGGKASGQLDGLVGSFGISFSQASGQTYAFGYPAAGKYIGSDLTYCSGTVFNDSWNSNQTLGMACDMTGGSSGGPWLTGFSESTGSGTLNGLNSYGYSGVRNMYGPKFNTNTKSTFDRANQAPSSNQIVNVPA